MQAVTKQLLEAQVQHELARFSSKKLAHTVRVEVAAVFEWLQRTKLRDVIVPAQVVGLITRIVVELPLAGGITDLTRSMSRRVLASRQNRTTAVQDVCTRKSFDAAVSKLASLEGARRELIHRLVSSSVYTEQISDVLFNGIKEYLLTENILAQKVPGLASLIRLGKFAVNKTMKPLEAAVEKTVKAYIESNLGSTLRRSEQSINDYLAGPRLVEMSDPIWAAVAKTKLADYSKMVNGDDMDDFVAIGHDFWLNFRKTPYFKAIYTDLVQHFFDKYGDSELGLIVASLGVTEKTVVAELLHMLSPGVETALTSGFLEQRIRAQLEPFYRAPETLRLLAGLVAAPMKEAPKTVRKAPATAAVKKSTPRKSATKVQPG